MEKVIKVDGRDVPILMSADTLRVYRRTFSRDLMVDMQSMQNRLDAEVMENLLWVSAKAADPELPDIDEWLKGFTPFAVIMASGDILQAWNEENATLSTPKKKQTP